MPLHTRMKSSKRPIPLRRSSLHCLLTKNVAATLARLMENLDCNPLHDHFWKVHHSFGMNLKSQASNPRYVVSCKVKGPTKYFDPYQRSWAKRRQPKWLTQFRCFFQVPFIGSCSWRLPVVSQHVAKKEWAPLPPNSQIARFGKMDGCIQGLDLTRRANSWEMVV